MDDGEAFIDYYSILQVDPQCSTKVLALAYRRLAGNYHPDHPETADPQRFADVIEAYRFLRRADKRSDYDALYARRTGYSFAPKEPRRSEVITAVSDSNMHGKMLMYLYWKRRDSARHPGAGTYDILRNLECSEDLFEFHVWYLRRKGFIEHTEDGQYAITVEGVDHVISMSQIAERTLRITGSDDSDPAQWADQGFAAATVQ